jgi:uncharacterized protein (TIGR02246 family)
VNDDGEIRNVVARLAQWADSGDLDDYVDLFTPDAAWDMPGAPRRGHDEIRAGAEGRRAAGEAGPGTHTRHVVTTTAVTVDRDTATADSYWLFYRDTAATPMLHGMGAYRDHLVRVDGRWKVARREIVIG